MGKSDSITGQQPRFSRESLDFSRALSAVRKGWVSAAEFDAARRAPAPGGSIVARLHEAGALDDGRLADLFGSNVLLSAGGNEQAGVELGEDSDEPQPGDTINGCYRVFAVKRGGFGSVCLCDRCGDDVLYYSGVDKVAVKLARREHLANSLELFLSEATNWISLGAHPHLVTAYGVELYRRLPVLVLEYVEDGRTLAQEIRRRGADWRHALRAGTGSARGFAHIEAAGFFHGDIKPLNILLTPEDVPKVTDLGLSQVLGDAAPDGKFWGTPGYLPPGAHLGTEGMGGAADVYAFGVTLFEMAAGVRPFPDADPFAALRAPAPDVREIAPDVPPPLAELISECLAEEPGARPTGFTLLADRLDEMHALLLGARVSLAECARLVSAGDAARNLASSWMQLGRYEEAERHARRAIPIASEKWKAHNTLGGILIATGRVQEAAEAFAAALDLAPREIAPLMNCARVCRDMGQQEEAEFLINHALVIARAEGRMAQLDSGSFTIAETLPADDALAVLDEITAANPLAAVTWNNRAILLRRMGNLANARTSIGKAIEINPAYAKAWSNRATIFAQLRLDSEEVIFAARRALELDPKLGGAYAAWAIALARAGRLAEARTKLEEGLELMPGDPILMQALERFSH